MAYMYWCGHGRVELVRLSLTLHPVPGSRSWGRRDVLALGLFYDRDIQVNITEIYFLKRYTKVVLINNLSLVKKRLQMAI